MCDFGMCDFGTFFYFEIFRYDFFISCFSVFCLMIIGQKMPKWAKNGMYDLRVTPVPKKKRKKIPVGTVYIYLINRPDR